MPAYTRQVLYCSGKTSPAPYSGLRQDKPTLRMKTQANSHYLVAEPDQMLGFLSVQPGNLTQS